MNQKKMIFSLLFYFISALGISLSIKSMIGVSSFTALNTTLSALTHIQVGTITTFLNLSFLLSCWFLDPKRKKGQYLLMAFSLLCFGEIINLLIYHLFIHFSITSYFLRLFLFILGTVIGGYGTGQVLRLDLLKFPIENFCQLIANQSNHDFSFYRYGIDGLCVGGSLLLSLVFQLPFFVREGTVISLLLLSGIINWSKNLPVPKRRPSLVDN